MKMSNVALALSGVVFGGVLLSSRICCRRSFSGLL